MNNKFIAMVIVTPNILERQIDFIQNNITNLFEQYGKVQKVWYLGRKKLDYKIKKYTEGFYLKFEITAKGKNINNIKKHLKNNKKVIFSLIIKNEENKNNLPIIQKLPLQFSKCNQINTINTNNQNKKVYMLISKNLKLPFAESNILAISDNKNKVFEVAYKKLQNYIYVKGYKALSTLKTIKDLEKELKRKWKIEFVLGNNPNIGEQLLIKEQYLI